MSSLLRRLRDPAFGTETTERNLMNAAADEIERLTRALTEIAEVDDDGFTSDGHERCVEWAARATSKENSDG